MVDCNYSNSSESTRLEDTVDKVIALSEAVIWAVRYLEQIFLGKQKIRDKRLNSELRFDMSQRVGDDLDRFFCKTLSEWRYLRDAIVMAQEVPAIAGDKKLK